MGERILLVNVDNRWNLAIRRMYNYYTQQGHTVEMVDLGFKGYPHKRTKTIDGKGFDKVFVSNIFEQNAYKVDVINCDQVEYGGIGSRDPNRKLPIEIEMCAPYYYPGEKDTYGFITRGCIRKCWFCKVPKHEGKLSEYHSVHNIIRGVPGEVVHFMDNNILAYPKHMEVFNYLIKHNIRCEFNQGLDFRLVTDENLEALSKLKYVGAYIFAFDDPKYQKLLDRKIVQIKKYISTPWKLKFYIYYHPNMEIRELIERVEWCRSNECLPYIMRDSACWDCDNRDFIIDYTAYCNQAATFKKMSFFDFLLKRTKNEERRTNSYRIYEEGVRANECSKR